MSIFFTVEWIGSMGKLDDRIADLSLSEMLDFFNQE